MNWIYHQSINLIWGLLYFNDRINCLLNVSLFEDIVVYGLFDGSFRVYDMKKMEYRWLFSVTAEGTYSRPLFGNDIESNELPLFDSLLTPMVSTLLMQTLAISNGILITNGCKSDQINIWDFNTGCFLYAISESISLARLGIDIAPFRDIKFAEMCRDVIYSSVSHGEYLGLSFWDFGSFPKRVSKVFVELGGDSEERGMRNMEVWLVGE